jgi:hypothetical protein
MPLHYLNRQVFLTYKKSNKFMSSHSISSGLEHTLLETTFLAYDKPLDTYDVIIRFLSAEVIQ